MFEYIKGTLVDSSPEKAIVDVSGLGYSILIPLSTFAKLPQTGTEVCFYTAFIVREDSQTLFGFLTREEKFIFEQLEKVSGIGPKTALALIGHMEMAHFLQAVTQGDITSLCRVPHIGKKTAERLIIELRDKLKKTHLNIPTSDKEPSSQVAQDAISALINLGYGSHQAQKVIQKILDSSKQEPKLPELISSALRSL